MGIYNVTYRTADGKINVICDKATGIPTQVVDYRRDTIENLRKCRERIRRNVKRSLKAA